MQHSDHRVDLSIGSFGLDGCGTHDIPTKGAMPDHKPGVDGNASLETLKELSERPPRPRQPSFKGFDRHTLDDRHHSARVTGVFGANGCKRKAAIAADNSCDPMLARWRR